MGADVGGNKDHHVLIVRPDPAARRTLHSTFPANSLLNPGSQAAAARGGGLTHGIALNGLLVG